MNAPLDILAALASYSVKVVIENGRVRLVCPKDDPPPAELIEVARTRKDELRALLTDDEQARQDAARAKAEAVAGAELTGDTQEGTEGESDLHDGDGVLLGLGTAELRAECPAYVDVADWQQAIEDGHRFVTKWGKQAEALGWAPADLFRLHTPPEKPVPNYRRISRYDQTGLIWLLHGRPVIALTQTAATILAPSGASLMYRRSNKLARGLLRDGLQDMLGGRP
jgi:hypothetical protein